MKKIDLMRPQEFYEQVLRQREADGIDFYKNYCDHLVDFSCPSCGSESAHAFDKYGFKHRRCVHCKTLFCSPRPDDRLLTVYYNKYDSPRLWTTLLLKADTERKVLQYNPRVEKIISAIKNNSTSRDLIALDLGAGSGAFAICLKKSGFFKEVVAIDISQNCVEACKNLGLDTIQGTISDVKDNFADLICMNDLIEHLYDPLAFLKECHRVLSPGGYLSIATPNGEGFDFKILKENTKNITPPEHLTYFNPYSIGLILDNAGFTPIYVETPGQLDVDMVLKDKENGFPISEKNEYIDFLLTQDEAVLLSFQKFLSGNKLSSHMLVLAQKK